MVVTTEKLPVPWVAEVVGVETFDPDVVVTIRSVSARPSTTEPAPPRIHHFFELDDFCAWRGAMHSIYQCHLMAQASGVEEGSKCSKDSVEPLRFGDLSPTFSPDIKGINDLAADRGHSGGADIEAFTGKAVRQTVEEANFVGSPNFHHSGVGGGLIVNQDGTWGRMG